MKGVKKEEETEEPTMDETVDETMDETLDEDVLMDEDEGFEDGEGEELNPEEPGLTPADKRRRYRISRYQKRFGQVSETGGLELEDVESDSDEKGELKVTMDGELLGGMFTNTEKA